MMRVSVLARAAGIAALTTLSVPIMGAGPECPTPCVVAATACAPFCGDPVTRGTCNQNLVCNPNDVPKPPDAAPPDGPDEIDSSSPDSSDVGE